MGLTRARGAASLREPPRAGLGLSLCSGAWVWTLGRLGSVVSRACLCEHPSPGCVSSVAHSLFCLVLTRAGPPVASRLRPENQSPWCPFGRRAYGRDTGPSGYGGWWAPAAGL